VCVCVCVCTYMYRYTFIFASTLCVHTCLIWVRHGWFVHLSVLLWVERGR
jgi:hypothetical protein